MLCDDDVKYCPLGRQIFRELLSYHGRYLSKVSVLLKLYEGTQKFRANYNSTKHNYS